MAEYAVAQGIENEPGFNWWVPFVLKKRERIIKSVKDQDAKYLKYCIKFGIEVPRSVREALELDKKNGNTLWADAIRKEMECVRRRLLLQKQDWWLGGIQLRLRKPLPKLVLCPGNQCAWHYSLQHSMMWR